MSRSNLGSNVRGGKGKRRGKESDISDEVPEPIMTTKKLFKCPVCNSLFSSKKDYISHAMAIHQLFRPETEMSPATA